MSSMSDSDFSDLSDEDSSLDFEDDPGEQCPPRSSGNRLGKPTISALKRKRMAFLTKVLYDRCPFNPKDKEASDMVYIANLFENLYYRILDQHYLGTLYQDWYWSLREFNKYLLKGFNYSDNVLRSYVHTLHESIAFQRSLKLAYRNNVPLTEYYSVC